MKRRVIGGLLALALILALALMAAPIVMADEAAPATGAAVTEAGGVGLLKENVLLGQLAIVMILILLDWIFSVANSLRTGRFDWGETPRFLVSNVVPYVIVWGSLACAGWAANYLRITDAALWSILVFVEAAYAIVFFRLSSSILACFKAMEIGGAGGPADTNPGK